MASLPSCAAPVSPTWWSHPQATDCRSAPRGDSPRRISGSPSWRDRTKRAASVAFAGWCGTSRTRISRSCSHPVWSTSTRCPSIASSIGWTWGRRTRCAPPHWRWRTSGNGPAARSRPSPSSCWSSAEPSPRRWRWTGGRSSTDWAAPADRWAGRPPAHSTARWPFWPAGWTRACSSAAARRRWRGRAAKRGSWRSGPTWRARPRRWPSCGSPRPTPTKCWFPAGAPPTRPSWGACSGRSPGSAPCGGSRGSRSSRSRARRVPRSSRDGLAGGRHQALVRRLRIGEAQGTVLDHLHLISATAARRSLGLA